MINIQYTMSAEESAKATLDFLSNRPFISFMYFVMKVSCIGFCFGFWLTLRANAARPQDCVIAVLAIIWLFSFRRINKWLIKKRLSTKHFKSATNTLKIDHKSILSKFQFSEPQHIEWKKLRYILQNKDGYIIPLTGVRNAGRFMWLPHRSFNDTAKEQDFLDLVNKFKLKIKKISGK